MTLLENARNFAEGGYSYTGEEVRLWVYKLCDEIERLRVEDASLTNAYAEGRGDQRYADAEAIEAMARKIRLGLA
jgi:hypothetical protein